MAAGQKRRSKTTPKKLGEFLAQLAATGNAKLAAEACNLDRRKLYRLRTEDEAFAASWADAMDAATEVLEAEARRRALDGWEEPVFYQGVETGLVRRFSDTLLIFLLKAARPERYRDNHRVEHTGAEGGPITGEVQVQVYLPGTRPEEQA